MAAGSPKPSDDHREARIDITRLLIDQPTARSSMRVAADGDSSVVDKAGEWVNGAIVVARIGDDFTSKRIRKRAGRVFLPARNRDFPPLGLTEAGDGEIGGVVTGSVRRH